MPPNDFLDLQALVDVVLDTTHFTGGRTSIDALAFGTPVVTLPGQFMRGRVTYACYHKMGLLDCVARTAQDYIDNAVRLGTDRAWHDHIRSEILARNHVLFENRAICYGARAVLCRGSGGERRCKFAVIFSRHRTHYRFLSTGPFNCRVLSSFARRTTFCLVPGDMVRLAKLDNTLPSTELQEPSGRYRFSTALPASRVRSWLAMRLENVLPVSWFPLAE